MLVTHHCRRVLLDDVQSTDMFVCVTFIATLIRFVTTLLVHEKKNNGDKLCCIKSMRVADEKLVDQNRIWFESGMELRVEWN